MLASDHSHGMRAEMCGVFSSTDSSTALATSSSPRLARVRPARMTLASGAFGAAPQSFHRAVGVAGEHQLGDLLHERRRVEVCSGT